MVNFAGMGQKVVEKLADALSKKAGEIQTQLEDPDFDPTDAGQLLKLQMQVNNYQQIASLISAIVSDVKQTAQSIIQKI